MVVFSSSSWVALLIILPLLAYGEYNVSGREGLPPREGRYPKDDGDLPHAISTPFEPARTADPSKTQLNATTLNPSFSTLPNSDVRITTPTSENFAASHENSLLIFGIVGYYLILM